MIWNMDIQKIEFSSCFDSITKMILDHFNFDCNILKLENFYTAYIKANPGQKESVTGKLSRGCSLVDSAEYFYGLKAEYLSVENVNVHDEISRLIKDMPVGVYCDPFFCKWSPLYQHEHWGHIILIVDIDFEKNIYTCVDVYYFKAGYIKLTFDEMEKLCSRIVRYQFNAVNRNHYDAVMDFFRNHIRNVKKNVAEDNGLFIRSFTEELSLSDIGEPDKLEKSILLIKLLWAAEDKGLFLDGLRHIERIYYERNLFESVYEPVSKVKQKFIVLSNLLMRNAIMGTLQYSIISDIVKEICALDNEILEQLESIVMSGNVDSKARG